ncbi:MAG: glycosyl hydrolase [Parabacteroides sp.]|nr:glycosyl hydrolase [Parabacteroides sp.]
MERRKFLRIISSTGMASLLSPAFVMNACKGGSSAASFTPESAFRHPPFHSGVYTWWHWMNGNITKEGITRDLEAMKANGVAGFQLFEAGSGIPVGPVESLSDVWIDLVLHTLKESERLGLEFAMHNCPGWSSSGGPWITPDKAMQMITWSETTLAGGNNIQLQLPIPEHRFDYYLDTYCLAIPADMEIIPKDSVINLTSQLNEKGFLSWNVPAGRWTILRFGQTAKDQKNHSAPTLATGLDCDKFNTNALDYHLDCMFKKLMPTMEVIARHTKVGLLIDSYEMGEQTWTYDMPEYFEQNCDYPLWPFLPIMANRIIESEETTNRFRFDFRRTQADMFADRYYTHFQKRCKEKGIITYTEPYGGGMMEELQVAQRLDINMGEFWCGQTVLWPNFLLNRTVKQIASVAHTLGGSIVGAEAFTSEPNSDKWLLYPYSLKSLGDYMFTRGLSRIYFHRFAHQPHPTASPGMTMGPWGLHFDRTNTWWKPGKAWIEYLNRCQHIFQSSTFYADILYHSGDDTFGTTMEPEQTLLAPPEGYDYDIINTEILDKASVKNGKIFLPGTCFDGYKLLVLLKPGTMSLQTVRTLDRLVGEGMILVGKKPQQSLGLLNVEQESEFATTVDRLWQQPNVCEEMGLQSLLQKRRLSPDFIYHSANKKASVHAVHYQRENTEIYFIANSKREYVKGVAYFRLKEYVPEFWDPYAAEITPCAVYRNNENGIEIPLDLAPSGSMFVIFSKKDKKQQFLTDVRYNGISLFSYPATQQTEDTVSSDFSITCWIKPELDIALTEEQEFGSMRTRCFAIYPSAGETRYGKGHSAVGLSVGRNGIVVYERSVNNKAVFRKPIAISGWTHLGLVYQDNTPSLWLNGECIGVGVTSETIVHGPDDIPEYLSKTEAFTGELCQYTLHPYAIELSAIFALYKEGMPMPLQQENRLISWLPGQQFVAWKTGLYELNNGEKILQKHINTLPKPISLDGVWTIQFQKDRGAPEKIKLNKLCSLHLLEDFGVRHFSGTMIYSYTLQITEEYLQDNLYLRLDLGRVEVITEIWVNGVFAATCWAPPYAIDIHKLLHKGENQIELCVTNLWVNRLIGDEYMPEENQYTYQPVTNKFAALNNGSIQKLPDWYVQGKPKPAGGRVAFTTWKHYKKRSPLVESGLLGPVTLCVGRIESYDN